MPIDPPTVTTQAATNVQATSCTGNGNITDIGYANCTRRGFCYVLTMGTWSSGGALTTARSSLGGCGTQSAGLSFGGGSYSVVTEEYNGTSWSSGGNLATGRTGLGGCGTQTAGLSFGGHTGSDSAVTEEYDGSSWSSGGNLTTAKIETTGCGTQTAGLGFGGHTLVPDARSLTTEEYAALEAISGPQDDVEEMRKTFSERREFLLKALNEMDGVTAEDAQGAFYLFPDFSSFFGKSFNETKIEGSMDLAMYLIAEAQVATVPGSVFGAEGFMRIAYATSVENLEEGIERIKVALNKLS